MQSELKIFEGLILKKLKNACYEGNLSVETLEQWKVIALSQQEIIENCWVDTAFKCKQKRFIHYIHRHQSRLIFLEDMLYNITLQQSGCAPLLNEIYQVLENLLNFIHAHFPEFENSNQAISNRTKVESVRKFKAQLSTIKRKLHTINSQLADSFLYPIQSATDDHKPVLTYNQLSYLDLLINQLINLRPSQSNDTINDPLVEQLIGINFNSWRFFKYLVNDIRMQIQNEESLNTQIKILSLYLKLINQANVRTDVIFNPSQKGINVMLSQWLIEELNYHEKQLQLCRNTNSKSDSDNFKVNYDLSVPQLGCHLRIMHEIGAITNKNITTLTEFFANHSTTKRTENISAESLRIKFNVIDDSARTAVKAMLIKMLNELNKNNLPVFLYWFADNSIDLFFQ